MRRRGLTLTELLVSLVLVMIIAGGLLLMLTTGHSSFLSADASVVVQQEARRALDDMVKELHEAGGTITPGAGQLDFQIALGYNLAAPCPANAVCWGARDQNGVNQPSWNVRYRVSGTQLVREIVNAAGVVQPGTRVLANRVNSATTSFAWAAGTRTVTVNLALQYQSNTLTGGSRSLGTLTSRIRLRNT